jgi:cytochrome c2
MKRWMLVLLLASPLLFAGCAKKSEEAASTPAPEATPTAAETTATTPAGGELLATSLYDDGPRAAEGKVDAVKAAAGEKLFTSKACATCHAYGKKLLGPDLKGVTTRRTAAWMEQQIMHPDVMTKTDPIAHALMLENKNLQMLNMHLTQAEAQSLIEYLKKLDAAK